MARARGSVVINEMILPVVDIALRDGGLLVTVARVIGQDTPAGSTDSYTLMDDSGRVVGRGRQHIEWPEMVAGDVLQTELFIRLEGKLIRPVDRRPARGRWL